MGAEAFKAARDFLFVHRTVYRTAHAEFRWPQLEDFNYALDWFDTELAGGPLADSPALTIVGEGAATRTFAELSAAGDLYATIPNAIPGPNPGASMNPLLQGTPC